MVAKKGMLFNWNELYQAAIKQLSQKLMQARIQYLPIQTLVLKSEPSDTGISGVLEQDVYGHVAIYASRTLSFTERNYNVISLRISGNCLLLNNSDTTSLVTSSYFSLATFPVAAFKSKYKA